MKYLKIKDEDYEKTEKLLKENNISFEENDPMYFNIEDRLTKIIDVNLVENISIDEAMDFLYNRTNPLDFDAIIQEALLIYESEENIHG